MTEKQRGYIRMISMGTEMCVFEIPDWKPNVWIQLSKWSVPPFLRGHLHPGFRCWISFNPNANVADELNISNWG
jgi:hypothetical protein